ncbi:MAG: NCS2 family permease [Polyangiaceae bacterium]|nr:NCS2 family permease [Polyangiaceae bacterium]
MTATAPSPGPGPRPTVSAVRWFVWGDIDGFFGLALDNLVQVLVVIGLLTQVVGVTADTMFGRVLPGISVSLLVGNLFYAWQASRLARRTGRRDVCALPYGINTPSVFAFVLLVMLPVKHAALGAGQSASEAADTALRAGILAGIGSGIIEAAGAWAVGWLRRFAPRAAMLSTLAGVAVTFIAADFLFRTFAVPMVAFLPLGIILVTYFGGVRFPLGLPGGFVAVAVGTALAWATPLRDWNPVAFASAVDTLGFHPATPILGDLYRGLVEGHLTSYFAIVLPMGLFNLIGSVQNLESAAAAGDDYPTVPSLLANGVGTLLGAAFGSPFPTTIYIGHPGWKALGARIGYSVLNAAFFTILGLSGAAALVAYFVPIESGMAIVLWIGIVMVAQAFQATPRAHAPAAAVGLLPGIAAWGAFMLKQGLRGGGLGSPDTPFDATIAERLTNSGVFAGGVFALEQGALLTSLLWAAMVVEIIERRFSYAATWALVGAMLSFFGLIHSYAYTVGDTVQALVPGRATAWSVGYLLTAALLVAVRWLPNQAATHDP